MPRLSVTVFQKTSSIGKIVSGYAASQRAQSILKIGLAEKEQIPREIFPGQKFFVIKSSAKTRHGNANLRTKLARVIRKAGVDPWPRLWHSVRASCESDLAQSFPLATVTKWLRNTPSVALRHYVDPTEAAFDRAATWIPTGGSKSGSPAAQKAAQQAAAGNGRDSQKDGVNDDGVPTCATPCDSPHDYGHAFSGGKRTPVELFLAGIRTWWPEEIDVICFNGIPGPNSIGRAGIP